MISTRPDAIVLLGCGATKQPHAAQPIDLYLGPMWQTLRTRRGALPAGNVFVLSAGYGFISALTFIQTYEARLTPAIADRLIARGIFGRSDLTPRGIVPAHCAGPCAADVLVRPGRRGDRPARQLIIAAGGEYRRVLQSFVAEFREAGLLDRDCSIEITRGGIGEQRSQLGRWLDRVNGIEPIELQEAA